MVPVTGIAVVIPKFPFGMCNCIIDSDVGMGDFSVVLGILDVCRHTHMQLHVSLCMNFYIDHFMARF